ncbi:MAG: ATP-binding protein [Christensenellales bacterium]
MRDLSLHLIDLVHNGIAAGAQHIHMSFALDNEAWLTMVVEDDGCGMDEDTAQRALGPFSTSRTTRKVGLGIPLTLANARLTGGDLTIDSQKGSGTRITATFRTDHIDCIPMGDVAQTVAALVAAYPNGPEFSLALSSPRGEEAFDTAEVRQVLQEVPLDTPEVVDWITQSLREQVNNVFGG